jgi:hypothetical protein
MVDTLDHLVPLEFDPLGKWAMGILSILFYLSGSVEIALQDGHLSGF